MKKTWTARERVETGTSLSYMKHTHARNQLIQFSRNLDLTVKMVYARLTRIRV